MRARFLAVGLIGLLTFVANGCYNAENYTGLKPPRKEKTSQPNTEKASQTVTVTINVTGMS